MRANAIQKPNCKTSSSESAIIRGRSAAVVRSDIQTKMTSATSPSKLAGRSALAGTNDATPKLTMPNDQAARERGQISIPDCMILPPDPDGP
jgi:hypothetical protein